MFADGDFGGGITTTSVEAMGRGENVVPVDQGSATEILSSRSHDHGEREALELRVCIVHWGLA